MPGQVASPSRRRPGDGSKVTADIQNRPTFNKDKVPLPGLKGQPRPSEPTEKSTDVLVALAGAPYAVLPPIATSRIVAVRKGVSKELRKVTNIDDKGFGPQFPAADSEKDISYAFQNAVVDNDPLRQAVLLQMMANLYIQKPNIELPEDIFKASGVCNCGILRAASNNELTSSLRQTLHHIERMFIENYVLVNFPKFTGQLSPIVEDSTQVCRKNLSRMRSMTRKQLRKIADMSKEYQSLDDKDKEKTSSQINKISSEVQNMYTRVRLEYRSVVKDIVTQCTDVLGPPPCRFAIVGVGDCGLNVMSQFSELEYMILTQDSAQNNINYFIVLAHYIHLKVTSLCETPLTATGAKILQDFYSKTTLSLFDNITPKGLMIDMHPSSKSLHPFRLKNYKELQEMGINFNLIGPPREIQRIHSILQRKGYIEETLRLNQPFLFHGDMELFNDYKDSVEASLMSIGNEDRTKAMVAEQLEKTIKVFDDYPVEDLLHQNGTTQALKLYSELRNIPQIIHLLKYVYKAPSRQPFQMLEDLRSKYNISSVGELDLKLALSYTLFLIMSAESRSGNGLIGRNSVHNIDASKSVVRNSFGSVDAPMCMKIYGAIFPLCDAIKQFCETKKKSTMAVVDFHHAPVNIQAKVHYKIQDYDASFELIKNHSIAGTIVAQFQGMCTYGHVALMANQPKEARAFFTKAMDLKERIEDPELKAVFFIQAWCNMGLAHHHEDHFEKAVTFYTESIDMLQELGDTQPENKILIHTTHAIIHHRLGNVKFVLKRYKESFEELQLALEHYEMVGEFRKQVHHDILRQIAVIQMETVQFKPCLTTLRHLVKKEKSTD